MTGASQQWIHMVGIGGAGMSGIARILWEKGYKVSGSDLQKSNVTAQLEKMGIKIFEGHSASNVEKGVDLLVISSAIPEDNYEVCEAQIRDIPVIKRGQMLANLVNSHQGIAIAGAHGKTTTTSMIYYVFDACGVDPTYIIGGELQGTNMGAKLGKSEYYVIEADESDASFLELKPFVAVVTNIENDHLDYYKNVENIKKAFSQFIGRVKPEGFALLCGDDRYTREMEYPPQTRIIWYGENQENDYYIKDWTSFKTGSKFQVGSRKGLEETVELVVPGKHNALNALSAIAVACELGLDVKKAIRALKSFRGAKRRFELIGHKKGIMVVDDYAHHPTEIQVTLEAARSFHKGRLIVVFQPHRFTRTQNLSRELGESFKNTDLVIFTEVYAAGEKPIEGVNGRLVYEAAKKIGCESIFIPDFEGIEQYLRQNARENDLIITMGAGNVWKIGPDLLERIDGSVLHA